MIILGGDPSRYQVRFNEKLLSSGINLPDVDPDSPSAARELLQLIVYGNYLVAEDLELQTYIATPLSTRHGGK